MPPTPPPDPFSRGPTDAASDLSTRRPLHGTVDSALDGAFGNDARAELQNLRTDLRTKTTPTSLTVRAVTDSVLTNCLEALQAPLTFDGARELIRLAHGKVKLSPERLRLVQGPGLQIGLSARQELHVGPGGVRSESMILVSGESAADSFPRFLSLAIRPSAALDEVDLEFRFDVEFMRAEGLEAQRWPALDRVTEALQLPTGEERLAPEELLLEMMTGKPISWNISSNLRLNLSPYGETADEPVSAPPGGDPALTAAAETWLPLDVRATCSLSPEQEIGVLAAIGITAKLETDREGPLHHAATVVASGNAFDPASLDSLATAGNELSVVAETLVILGDAWVLDKLEQNPSVEFSDEPLMSDRDENDDNFSTDYPLQDVIRRVEYRAKSSPARLQIESQVPDPELYRESGVPLDDPFATSPELTISFPAGENVSSNAALVRLGIVAGISDTLAEPGALLAALATADPSSEVEALTLLDHQLLVKRRAPRIFPDPTPENPEGPSATD